MNWLWFTQHVSRDFGAAELRRDLRHRRSAVWLGVIGLGAFLSWAQWAQIDEVTRATGTVIASSKTKVVQASETGVIADILVEEGQRVREGQVVVELRRDQSESVLEEIRAERATLLAIQARLNAEISGGEPIFPALLADYPQFLQTQQSLFDSRKRGLEEELSGIRQSRDLVPRELSLLRPLLDSGDVSESDVLQLERQLAELNGRSQNVSNGFMSDASAELVKVESDLASVEQRLSQSQSRLEQTTLKAPVNGLVKNLAVNTLGGVVRPGEVLMEILPVDDSLLIELKIPPAEIAFVKEGMTATIKMDAYDYTIFGDLNGQLTYVSPDTLLDQTGDESVPFYRGQVESLSGRFSKRPDFEFDIIPGMTASVEINTGSNTVLSYLTKPLTKTLSEALAER